MIPEIIYVNHAKILGGGEISLLNLLRKLDRDQYSPLVACPGPGPLTQELDKLEIPYVNFPISIHSAPMQFARGVWKIKSQTRYVKIVHGNSTRSLRVAVVLGKLLGAKIIWQVRDRVRWESFPTLERWFARQVDTVIANSNAVLQRLGSLSGQVVYNPVDIEQFHPDRSGKPIREELGVAPDEPLIGIVGRITVWKGHQTFIEALQLVKKDFPHVKALIVGEQFQRSSEADRRELNTLRQDLGDQICPPSSIIFEEQDLRKLVHTLGLNNQVIFTGFRHDIPDVMAALDLLVLSSWWEPFGRVLIEAMASGNPVVATNLGGPAEIVKDGEVGFLVPPLDAQMMADAICKILSDPLLAARMSRKGRLEAKCRFSLSQYATMITDIYQNDI
jgi:glycosyltransferase involved in cell wall biosynthesis